MDSYNIFIIALLVVVILYLLLKKKSPSNIQKEAKQDAEHKMNTVRRDNAELRPLDEYSETLYTAKVYGMPRRFFLDVKRSKDGRQVLTISELKREIGGEKGFTVVVFANEIDKFKGALDRCYGYMKNPSPGWDEG